MPEAVAVVLLGTKDSITNVLCFDFIGCGVTYYVIPQFCVQDLVGSGVVHATSSETAGVSRITYPVSRLGSASDPFQSRKFRVDFSVREVRTPLTSVNSETGIRLESMTGLELDWNWTGHQTILSQWNGL